MKQRFKKLGKNKRIIKHFEEKNDPLDILEVV